MADALAAEPTDRSAIVRTAADGQWQHDRFDHRIRLALPLLAAWTKKEYNIRYRQSVLGLAWSVIQPLAILAIFGGIMSGVLHVSSDGLPYISFAWAGLVPWTFVSSVLGLSVQSLILAMPIAGKVYFPREVVPLAQVCAFAIDLAIGTAILVVIVLSQGVGLSWTIVALVLIDAVIAAWVGAFAVFAATVAVFIRDLRFVVPLLLQLLFIGTPIMYSATLFPHRFAWINNINPVAVAVTSTRRVVLLHTWPVWHVLLAQAVAALVALWLAIAYLRSVEPRLVDVA
jgi:lipopolysaccharide transport system permease protein